MALFFSDSTLDIQANFKTAFDLFTTHLYNSLSSNRCLGIDLVTYIKFLDVPSVLGERFAKQAIEGANDTLSEADLKHSLKSLYNTEMFHQFKLAFQLYDSDDDNLISFSDVRLLLIHTFCLKSSSGLGHNKELDLNPKYSIEYIETLCRNFFKDNNYMDFKMFMDFCITCGTKENKIFYSTLFELLRAKLPTHEQLLELYTCTSSPCVAQVPKVSEKLLIDNKFSSQMCLGQMEKIKSLRKMLSEESPTHKDKGNLEKKQFLTNKPGQPRGDYENDNENQLACKKERSSAYTSVNGILYQFDKSELISKFHCILKFNCLFFYNASDISNPLFVMSLCNIYFSDTNPIKISNNGVNYYGFQLSTLNQIIIFYSENLEERNKWAAAFFNLIGCHPILSNYNIYETIETGRHSIVKKAVHKSTSIVVAIKVLLKSGMTKNDLLLSKREIDTLRICNHSNIAKLLSYAENENSIFLVFEYFKGSDLINLLLENNLKISDNVLSKIAYQIAKTIKYIHSIGIIHRDIKCENILVQMIGDNPIVQLIDFGLSKVVSDLERCKEVCGSLGYVAPEVLSHNAYHFPVDIWGFGVVLFALLSGELPFEENPSKEVGWGIINGNIIRNLQYFNRPSNIKILVERMLEKSPKKRISIDNVILDSWVSKFSQIYTL